MQTGSRFSAPAERNRESILEVLRANLPATGRVLEIASGTGQHVVHFAGALPRLRWQPSDPDIESLASIRAYIEGAGLVNIADPLALDVLQPWPQLEADAIITANLLHISEPEVLGALMNGAADVLPEDGYLHIYGPFLREGQFTSESNARFDASLRARNPAWGIRDLALVEDAAREAGFSEVQVRDMPANNFSLSFWKR